MPTRQCAECGTEFEAKRSTARFCGPTCRKRASRDSRDEIEALYAQAKELEAQQITDRGHAKNAEGKTVRGPYLKTPRARGAGQRDHSPSAPGRIA